LKLNKHFYIYEFLVLFVCLIAYIIKYKVDNPITIFLAIFIFVVMLAYYRKLSNFKIFKKIKANKIYYYLFIILSIILIYITWSKPNAIILYILILAFEILIIGDGS
jgi:hypothetical protein